MRAGSAGMNQPLSASYPMLASASLCLERLKNGVARLLTAAARLGADAAMLHLLAMLFALVAAEATRQRARLDDATQQRWLGSGLARHDRSGGRADSGAVQVEADAAGKLLDMLLTQAGVSARGTRLGAVHAGANTRDQRASIHG